MENAAWRNEAVFMYSPYKTETSLWKDSVVYKNNDAGPELVKILRKYCAKDMLRRRKFYINESGIKIKFETPLAGNIYSMIISEIHRNGLHFIWVSACVQQDNRNMLRNLMLPIDDFLQGVHFILCEADMNIFLFVIQWLGLLEEWKSWYTIYFDSLQDIQICTILMKCAEALKNWFPTAKMKYKALAEETLLSPVENGDYVEASAYLLAKKEIGNFIRRLPTGQQVSLEALEKARCHHMDLPAGFTFVSGFTRMQHIRNGLLARQRKDGILMNPSENGFTVDQK